MTAAAATSQDRRFAEAQDREKTGWQVTRVWDLHHQIKRLVFLGRKNTEIARELGCTKEQVSSVRNSEIVQRELAELHKQADKEAVNISKQIKELAPQAVKVLNELLEEADTPANVRLNAARDVLDRSGNQPPPTQVNHLHGHFTSDDLDAIKRRAQQLAENDSAFVANDEPIDITPGASNE